MSLRPMAHGIFVVALILSLNLQGATESVTVYKLGSCGCCKNWVAHLRANGFQVTAHDVPSTSEYRRKFGVPNVLGSCHTAVVGGYAIEGHVPAAEIRRLLKERPKATGLAVGGMPLGSPGMEASRRDSYNVVLFDAAGRREVYQHYVGN